MIWRLLKRMRLWIMNLYIKDLRILITLIFTLIFENKIELKKKAFSCEFNFDYFSCKNARNFLHDIKKKKARLFFNKIYKVLSGYFPVSKVFFLMSRLSEPTHRTP